MDIQELLEMLIKVVVIPAIPVVATFLVTALKTWVTKQSVAIENDTIKGYLSDVTEVISQAVMCTTQTYVDSLKAQGKFDEAAQKEAFEKTKAAVLSLLAQDAKDFITQMYGDLDLWLDTKIEQMVKETKSLPKAV